MTLLETVFAVSLLSVGALGMAGVFAHGMGKIISSPGELLATQKAAEAIESVFSARDSHVLVWTQLRNVAQGGVFKDGPLPLTTDGPDGILGTADDGPVESVRLPGPDGLMNTTDDVIQTLDTFTREIRIVDLSVDLRQITITITYKAGSSTRAYSLTALISNFA